MGGEVVPTFVYEARDRSGKVTNGTHGGGQQGAVALKLRESGLFITSLRQRQDGPPARPDEDFLWQPGQAARHRHPDQAVGGHGPGGTQPDHHPAHPELADTATRTQRILGQIRLDVEAGQPLAASLGKHPKLFGTCSST